MAVLSSVLIVQPASRYSVPKNAMCSPSRWESRRDLEEEGRGARWTLAAFAFPFLYHLFIYYSLLVIFTEGNVGLAEEASHGSGECRHLVSSAGSRWFWIISCQFWTVWPPWRYWLEGRGFGRGRDRSHGTYWLGQWNGGWISGIKFKIKVVK